MDRKTLLDRVGTIRREIFRSLDELLELHPGGLLDVSKLKADFDAFVRSVPVGRSTVGEIARRRAGR